jgi:4-hydroxy-L-threonine phosphate dehydrogenase PdxA
MTRIGLTLGDPCGIGPELWVKTLLLLRKESLLLAGLHLYGDAGVLDRTAASLGKEC